MDAWMITSLVLGGVNLVANIGEGIACGMINSKANTAIADAMEATNMAAAARQMAYNASANNNVPPTPPTTPPTPPTPPTEPVAVQQNSPAVEALLKRIQDLEEQQAQQQAAAANQATIEAIATSVAESMKSQFQGVIDSLNASKK